MPDAIDMLTEQEARALEQFQAGQAAQRERERRIAESMHGFDPLRALYCDDCGEQIDPERLAAYPLASRCTPCAANWEAAMRARWPK